MRAYWGRGQSPTARIRPWHVSFTSDLRWACGARWPKAGVEWAGQSANEPPPGKACQRCRRIVTGRPGNDNQ